MAIDIPLTFNSSKLNKFFEKLIKLIILIVWITSIIYFFYNYNTNENYFSFMIAIMLLTSFVIQIIRFFKRKKFFF